MYYIIHLGSCIKKKLCFAITTNKQKQIFHSCKGCEKSFDVCKDSTPNFEIYTSNNYPHFIIIDNEIEI